MEGLKTAARENISEKLNLFENDYLTDLANRRGEIDRRYLEWQESIETRLSAMGEEAETGRRELERGLIEEIRNKLSTQDEKLVSELEHLKSETRAFEEGLRGQISAFEEGIRGQISATDELVASFREQLDQSIEEARKEAELSLKVEIGKHSSASAESIKQYQRELDGKLREMSEYIHTRNSEITGLMNASRADLEEAWGGLTGKIKELDGTVENVRLRVREFTAETDSRITAVRSSVDDAEHHIKEAVDQTKLLDRAEQLSREMERRIEDLKADMDRLDQRRAEVVQLENDFVKIKRLEDDVNAKMTRFISEKRRLDTMEADFNRLLQISRSVEEKLSQLTASDDTLQGMQLQLRKLEEALGSAEDKFQRMEKKGQILDNTNDGIDRNFKVLQESEKRSEKIGGDLDRYAEDLETVKVSIEKLAGESEKAREVIERIDVLDDSLEEIEARIESMQRARQWLAEAETRLEELNRDAALYAKIIADGRRGGKKPAGGKTDPDLGDGAPPIRKRGNVLKLARQGWTAKEIAKSLHMSLGEVELVLQWPDKEED